MFDAFWKVMPVLAVGLGATAQAQDVTAAPRSGKPQPVVQTVVPCGINEPQCQCFARGCAGSIGGTVEADFLYWRAENSGFTYAFKNSAEVETSGKLSRINAHWDPGFRIGVGYNSDHDRWDWYTNWTWYQNKAHECHSFKDALGSQGYYSLYPSSDNPEVVGDGTVYQFNSVSARWYLQFNQVNSELGRAFYITPALVLRPHAGLSFASLYQTNTVHFNDGGEFSIPDSVKYQLKNNFWGVGPRVGIQSKWIIDNSSWSILARASTSLLLGKTMAKYDSSIDDVPTFARDDFSQAVPTVQLFLGVDWSSCISCERYYLGINAGWEETIYWNQFNIPTFLANSGAVVPGTGGHTLSLEGLTINMHLDY